MLAGDVHDGPTPRIVGGAETVPGEYPFMVSLHLNGSHWCGGSLIASDQVLTAAHCVESGAPASSYDAVIGRHAQSSNIGESIRVEEITIHPSYNTFTLDSDLAILKLATRSNAPTIEVATSADAELFAPGTNATVIGWGRLTAGGTSPDRLQEVTVPIVSNAVANAPGSYDGAVTHNMLAAGRTGRDSCQGDSGGPLLVDNGSGGLLQAGIVSWGIGCGDAGFPGIYTRVENFITFINDPTAVANPNDDHGNSFLTATPISIGTHSGQIEVANDEDWFSFQANANSTMVLETSLGSLSDSVLTLFDVDGITPIQQDDDGGNGLASRIEWSFSTAGRYYARVRGFGSARGTYNLRLDTIFQGDDHANDAGFATPVANGSFAGNIEEPDDTDWFSFEVTEGMTITLETKLNGLRRFDPHALRHRWYDGDHGKR